MDVGEGGEGGEVIKNPLLGSLCNVHHVWFLFLNAENPCQIEVGEKLVFLPLELLSDEIQQ